MDPHDTEALQAELDRLRAIEHTAVQELRRLRRSRCRMVCLPIDRISKRCRIRMCMLFLLNN